MACNSCETTFQGYQSLVVYFTRVGNTAHLYVQNQSRNTVLIQRILFCAGNSVLVLRAPPATTSWSWPSTYLENGTTGLFYTATVSANVPVQAQAEYIEIDGRARSCVF